MPVPNPILTLKTNSNNQIAGFINNELKINVRYGDTLLSVIDNLNNYRVSKIDKLYNNVYKEIPKYMWNFQIKENIAIFIDTPNNHYVNSYKKDNVCLI